jgi:hypothetical protein
VHSFLLAVGKTGHAFTLHNRRPLVGDSFRRIFANPGPYLDGSSYNSFQINKQTIINGADAEGRDTSGMVTPMGKQRIYSGPMFEAPK